ncbi:hypothetical protein PENSPDRAFT_746604 [Peniophora sp. CONT]|nr:hypothetical protein PENSPDRAFT_746604 [Peniophora sp. CONT]
MQFLALATVAFSMAATALAAPPNGPNPWHHGTPSAAVALAKSSATTKSASKTLSATATSTATASTSTTTYLSGTNSGDGTYYETGLGACGWTNTDTDYIVAVSKDLASATDNTNSNPVCGQKITASYNGNSVTVEVVDRCEGCDLTSLDFSPSAFTQLADQSVGLLEGMTWTWA